jgi:hypothetical protein
MSTEKSLRYKGIKLSEAVKNEDSEALGIIYQANNPGEIKGTEALGFPSFSKTHDLSKVTPDPSEKTFV